MALYSITFGDWSGDGHNITEEFYVNVSDNVSREELFENYKKNAVFFGFSPMNIAEGYEEPTVQAQQLEALVEAGFTYSTMEADAWFEPDGSILKAESSDVYYVDKYSLLSIVRFFFLHGLSSDVIWTSAQPQALSLIGSGGVNTRPQYEHAHDPVGYGLFSP